MILSKVLQYKLSWSINFTQQTKISEQYKSQLPLHPEKS